MGSFEKWIKDNNDIFGFKNSVKYTVDPKYRDYNEPKPNPDAGYFKKHADIFGFKNLAKKPLVQANNKPIEPIDVMDIVIKLSKSKVGARKATEQTTNSVQWGKEENIGSMELDLSPLGSWKAFIYKTIPDASGIMTKTCVSAIPLVDFHPHSDDPDVEDKIIDVLKQNLEECDKEKPFLSKKEYDLIPLIRSIDSSLRKELPIWFIYEGTKKLSEDHWIMYFSFRGAGAGCLHPTDHRLEQNNIDISFNKKTGLLRIFNQDIISTISVRSWIPSLQQWNVFISPQVPVKRIVHIVSHLLHTY